VLLAINLEDTTVVLTGSKIMLACINLAEGFCQFFLSTFNMLAFGETASQTCLVKIVWVSF
jgi:hypothetical protein